MQGKREEIAARVRELREIHGISPDDFAKKLAIAVSEYEAMEKSEIDFPASLLHEIAQILRTNLVTLLTGRDANMREFCVTRSGLGVEVKRREDYMYQNLAANFLGKKCEPFLVVVPVTDARPHSNSHSGQEFNYLLSGKMKVYIHDQEIVLSPGDSIYFNAAQSHAMQAIGGEPAKFLAIIL